MAFWKFAGEALTEGAFIKILSTLWNTLTTIHGNLPPEMQKKIPKWFGLTLDDEQIFNGVLGQLDLEQQIIITRFLQEKCKDYERNRFINVVAGMEVSQGKQEEKETKWDKEGNKLFEKVKAGSEGIDQRKKFLESFAKVIADEFDGDLQRAYEFCIGGRMIIKDPLHQKVLRSFSESIGWFKKIILAPFGAESAEDLLHKGSQKISDNSNFWVEKGASVKARYQAKVAARKSR